VYKEIERERTYTAVSGRGQNVREIFIPGEWGGNRLRKCNLDQRLMNL